ncbi:hypothetical protein P308_13945 [Pseudomonas piscis]|nr:hypothetical protein P308_13945 [Pseudomonas piscis]
MGGFGPAVAFQGAPGFGFGPFGQVGAGAKTAAAAAQHHHPYRRVVLAALEQAVQLAQAGNVQGIALVRAVEGDPGDTRLDLAKQRR